MSPTKLEKTKAGDEEEQIDIEGDDDDKKTPEKVSVDPDSHSQQKNPTATIDNKALVKTEDAAAISDDKPPQKTSEEDIEVVVKTEDTSLSKAADDDVLSSETESSKTGTAVLLSVII